MYQGSYIPINDFNGGYCGNLSPAGLGLNQALALDNIVILPGGKGWRTRLGNSKVNSTEFNTGNSSQGLGYFLTSSGTESFITVVGTKVGTNTKSAGSYQTSFTDRTGSLTISSGATKIWDFVTFNDVVYAYGGDKDNPDAPFQWTGTGNATAIGGSSKSAYGAFSANNRVFVFRTNSDPSTIFWSVLGDATDFSGAGSGSATVGSLSDNQKITASVVLGTNYVLIFKEASTHQMVISSNPFPVYTLFDSVGCVGKHAAIVVDGIAYWINQYKRMVSTDGENLKSYPPVADDLWNSVQAAQLPYIQAQRQKGIDYDWIVWTVSSAGSTNNLAIIWDLLNGCWLRCTTGYKMNSLVLDKNSLMYMGGYDGYVYQPDQSAVYADASETSPGTITAYWQSGWINLDAIEKVVQPNEIGVLYKTKASGSLTVYYGFDFIANSSNATVSQVATTTETRAFKYIKTSGRGNFFNYKIQQSSSAIDSAIDQIYIRGKEYGQKVFTNP